MKAVLVDDEKFAIELFKGVLRMTKMQLDIVGEASSLPEAIAVINSTQPDVVFMDIEMPGYFGLQIKDFFPSPRNFELVFITAHHEHVLDAMRMAAFDYLYKPLHADDLTKCLERLQLQNKSKSGAKLKLTSNPDLKKITITSHKGVEFVDLDQIQYLEASGMYCVFIVFKVKSWFLNH